ncbi:coatomer, beta' subunit [Actinidia rufa]|uniref:Coatomer subunit beta' n=1 Tax=Actinidia rufa TaxID=165716 RepID=A0A7J0FE94_9ERIC|nr:coatomer, beta' subunit [Actinidia rufa]
MVKSFEVTELPVRSAKFIARKQWVVAGADDMFIRVYNYNTMDKVKVYEAHTDYIRCVAVHPTLPYVLSSSDDMLIKLWDWDKGWVCTQTFEGHSHYVMQVTFNPKDTNTFASASLDRTIKIWNLGSPDPNFTLDAHLKGVNCVDYFTGGDKPYLITGSDDHTAKVWDYQTKSCVQTLEGHTHNVSAVCFHPELPIIITGSEDGTVRIWHATTYRLENTLNYGLERVWAIGCMKGSRRVVIGYDEGTIMVKLGREVPVASMDNSGKIIWAKHNEIQTVNIKSVGVDYEVTDGERLPLGAKELGTCDLYPQVSWLSLDVLGLYTKVKATLPNTSRETLSSGLMMRANLTPPRLEAHKKYCSLLEQSHSCNLAKSKNILACCIDSFSSFCIYALNGSVVSPRPTESLPFEMNLLLQPPFLCTATSNLFLPIFQDLDLHVLLITLQTRHKPVYQPTLQLPQADQKLNSAPFLEINSSLQAFPLSSLKHNPNGRFVVVCGDGEYIIYTALAWRNRSFGSALEFVWSLDGEYAVRESTSKIKIFSKTFQRDVVSRHLDSGKPVDEQGVEDAFELLCEINERARTGIWVGDCFIYNNSSWRLNYCVGGEVTTMFHLDRPMYLLGYLSNQSRVFLIDKEFNVIGYTLLLSLIEYKTLVMRGDLERANEILPSIPNEHHNSVARFLESRGMIEDALEVATDPDYRFELAVQLGKLEVAMEIASGSQSESKWKQLGELAMSTGMLEMAEDCLKNAMDLSECLQLLVDSNRIPEAALMARSYLPSKVSEIVAIWRKDLNKVNPKAAESLADPEEYANLFEDWQVALAVESKVAETRSVCALINVNQPLMFHIVDVEEENGEELHEEGQEEAQDGGQDEADSTDGVVLVNGNEPDEEWGTNTEGNPSA